MKWKIKSRFVDVKTGDVRIVKKFLLLPKFFFNEKTKHYEFRWLEKVSMWQKCMYDIDIGHYWKNGGWKNKVQIS